MIYDKEYCIIANIRKKYAISEVEDFNFKIENKYKSLRLLTAVQYSS